MSYTILWPTIALVALVWVVWFRLFVERMRHLKANPPGPDDFRDGEAALRYFRPVEMPANNLANLFEMPVLFFALVPLLLITDLASTVQVGLAWLYVALRVFHSLEHVVTKRVQVRFRWYLCSCAVLLSMWIGFAIDLVLTGR